MSNSPGRPKGTRVVVCTCGRRLAGVIGKRVPCPDCGKKVTIREKDPTEKAPQVYLPMKPAKKAKKK